MTVVCASEYGGPSDPTSGKIGYHGDNLTGRMAYAELGMGTALGGLPYGHRLTITYGGRSVVAEKLDIGLGGPGCGGHSRAIDLWWETAQALGFSGLAPVNVASASGGTTPIGFHLPGPELLPGEHKKQEELFEGGPHSPLHGIEAGASGVNAIGEFFTKVAALFFSKEGWIRIGKVLVGLFLLLTGVLGMANIQAGNTIVGAGGKIGKVGVGIAKGKV